MYTRRLVPDDFAVPQGLATEEFVLRPLTVNDLIKDYDAVMSSREHLRGLMDGTGWPDGLTLEENLVDLGWHQREFTLCHSFAYTVMAPDGAECLGCCYIYPPADPAGSDADAFYWARQSRLADGLEERLGRAFRDWIATVWPLARVAYPGRDAGAAQPSRNARAASSAK